MRSRSRTKMVACGGVASLALAVAAGGTPSQTSAATPMTALPASFAGAPDATSIGNYSSPQMRVELVLRSPRAALMVADLNNLYNPASPAYHHWLAAGQFNATFAPTAAQRFEVSEFLIGRGLHVVSSSSPFLIDAVGSSSTIEAAFHTSLGSFRSRSGTTFFTNTNAVEVPTAVVGNVAAVIGLSDTDRAHDNTITRDSAGNTGGRYGAGPGGAGLSPAQIDSLYGAAPALAAGPTGQGHGVSVAVFELSGFQTSDVLAYAHQYFGSSYNPDIDQINVDGGPVTPDCPSGDICTPYVPDYSGDIEVDADVETQIAVAPDATKFMVYNAPNDETGQTEIDEYMQVANDDTASVLSSSWGECEQDEGAAAAVGESVAFSQMAMQGQSVTASAGDTGAFDCLRDGTTNDNDVAVDDPASQPYVTAVGGTSFEGYDPGTSSAPVYPTGFETVWNDLDTCNGSANGLSACGDLGAGGGGVSVFWPRPSWQHGSGVTALDNREVPDVSANADEYTPYSEYCTGSSSTNSICAQISTTPAGWFGIGGTSLSSPLWSAIMADQDSFTGSRAGDAAPELYGLFRTAPTTYFHDITGHLQTENNNGLYNTTTGYDMATGLGTPIIGALVTEVTG